MKKIAVCVSAGAMLTSFSATMAFAANDDYARVDDYAAYTQTLTKADKAAIAAKEAESAKLAAASTETGEAATLIKLPGFNMYQQETNNYCVPACIKSALMYLVKSSPSQATIHNYTQLNFTKIAPYMNGHQSKCRYVVLNKPSLAALKNNIYIDIANKKVPVFLRISGTKTSNWYYATSGHCILATCIYTDKSKVQIGDPLGRRVTGCPFYYIKNTSTLKSFTTHMCW